MSLSDEMQLQGYKQEQCCENSSDSGRYVKLEPVNSADGLDVRNEN